MNDTTQRVRWWQVKVPPWTMLAILSAAGFFGLLIGFSIF